MEHRPMWTTFVTSMAMYGKLHEIKNKIDFVLHFLPVTYIKNVVILLQMLMPKKSVTSCKDMNFDEFLHVIGIFLTTDVHEIHGPRRLYWPNEHNRIFPCMNFREIISCKWFETITANSQLILIGKPRPTSFRFSWDQKKVSRDLTEKKQDLTEMSIILMVYINQDFSEILS